MVSPPLAAGYDVVDFEVTYFEVGGAAVAVAGLFAVEQFLVASGIVGDDIAEVCALWNIGAVRAREQNAQLVPEPVNDFETVTIAIY